MKDEILGAEIVEIIFSKDNFGKTHIPVFPGKSADENGNFPKFKLIVYADGFAEFEHVDY